MITHNSIGYDDQIKELLEKSMFNMGEEQIDNWLLFQYEPENMFCFWVEDKITSFIQTKRRILTYQGQKLAVSTIALAATLPDYRQRNQFDQLIEAVMERSSHNQIMCLVNTNFSKLFESRSFSEISKTKYYWIPSYQYHYGNDKNVHFYKKDIDLYPLYKEFISYFDGSIILSKDEFDANINYALGCKKKIALMYSEDKLNGFAIYKTMDNHIKIDVLVYLNTDAIYDLFKYLSYTTDAISFVASCDERFEKLFPSHTPRNQNTILARLNNYKLFSKWKGKEIRNAKVAFDEITGPMWNHFI